MAHYAKVLDGKVVQVIRAEASFFDNFVDTTPGFWIQTSYNTYGGVHYGANGNPDGGSALRMNYAGIGYSYDAKRDAFIPPKPYPSWILNETTCLWDPPIPYPADGKMYFWDEDTKTWKPMPTA
jgi:hypothetical protein